MLVYSVLKYEPAMTFVDINILLDSVHICMKIDWAFSVLD